MASINHDFPNWQTVYGYFRRWSEPINVVGHSQLDLILKKLSINADYTWIYQKDTKNTTC